MVITSRAHTIFRTPFDQYQLSIFEFVAYEHGTEAAREDIEFGYDLIQSFTPISYSAYLRSMRKRALEFSRDHNLTEVLRAFWIGYTHTTINFMQAHREHYFKD